VIAVTIADRVGTQLDTNVYREPIPARATMLLKIIGAAWGLKLEPVGPFRKELLSGLSGNDHG